VLEAFSHDYARGQHNLLATDLERFPAWDAKTRRCEAALMGHNGVVNACTFSPDGETIVSASGDEPFSDTHERWGNAPPRAAQEGFVP